MGFNVQNTSVVLQGSVYICHFIEQMSDFGANPTRPTTIYSDMDQMFPEIRLQNFIIHFRKFVFGFVMVALKSTTIKQTHHKTQQQLQVHQLST